jgi:transcriptional regulator GlxA family with amidase domain
MASMTGDTPTGRRPRRFVFLLLENFSMLSFAGALESLRIANRALGEEAYIWTLVGEGGGKVACSNGTEFVLDSDLPETRRDDTILVCGGIDVVQASTRPVINWLRREARRGRRSADSAPPPTPWPWPDCWTAGAPPSTGKTRTVSPKSSVR